jgi:predicted RecA/RadA family phage recombinase
MNIVGTVSILSGSIILLGLFLSIAYEGVRTKSTSKQGRIVGTVSILSGSIILLGLFLSIAYEGVRTKSTSKQGRVSVWTIDGRNS